MNGIDTTKCRERTREIYEAIPGYPKPPLIPLPEPDDLRSLEELGIVDTPLSRFIVRVALRLSGFRSFRQQLPNQLEGLLRCLNLRGAGLFALVNAATLALEDDPRALSPLERAATLILAARQFYRDLWSGRLEPDRFRDHILEMGQYPNFFSTCLTIDRQGARLFKSRCTNLITVIVRGQYFLLNVGDIQNDPPVEALVAALQDIVQRVQDVSRTRREASPGILTGVKHVTQMKIFRQFLQEPVNRESFQKIRHSFLTLCLDLDDHPADDAEAARLAHSANHHNRWYHASVQLVVFGNAKVGVICNFNTYVDGNPMMRFGAEIQERACRVPVRKGRSSTASKTLAVEPLSWVVKDEWRRLAEKDVQWVTDYQPATFVIDGIGQQTFLSHQLRPVPVFVIALQMAVQRLLGHPVNISQYLTMSRYRCMDLAIALVSTPEVNRLVQQLLQGVDRKETIMPLLQEAIRSQELAAREARKYLSLQKMLSLFLLTRTPWQRLYVMGIASVTVLMLRLLGLHRPRLSEVVLSHPIIYPQVPIIGRPGIRLPYVRYFGVHYQIMKDRIVLTLMPGIRWSIPNRRLVEMLRQSLEDIRALLIPERTQQLAH
ncbi:MAG: choline/carnitine O-acyltransferase [Calditrichaeota bacterium]|nr:choline/carnitine O-acyltransferase [Calditrichota bacterium]